MKRPTPLNAVQVFSVCARLQSFKQAADELHVTPGAVSRQIQSLEQHLGFRLFERQFRRVVLTHAGRLYYSHVMPALQVIEAAAAIGRDKAQRPPLQVEVTPTLAMHWLIPKLSQFQQAYPQIELQLSTRSGPIVRRKDVDLYLRRDPAHFAGLAGEAFMQETSCIVCSPEFLRKRPAIAADNIQEFPLVMMRSRPDLWRKWFEQNGQDIDQVKRQTLLDNTIFAIKATIEGLGVGLIPTLFIKDYLTTGVLVPVPQTIPFRSGSYSVVRAESDKTEQSGCFIDWLRRVAVDTIKETSSL